MYAEIKTLVDRQVLAIDHLWMLGVPVDELVDAAPGNGHGRPAVDDRTTGDCRCPDACGRDHPNE